MADPLTAAMGKLRAITSGGPTLRPREPVSIYEDEAKALLAERDKLLDIAESAICRRFTMTPCRERPEIDPSDYCETCRALDALEAGDSHPQP